MPPISAEYDPQSTRALKPVTSAASGCAQVAVAARSCAAITPADLQRGDLTGLRLGVYELGERIGHGGMGQVFLARHQALGKQFAIKFLAGDILRNPDAERRFKDEITSLGKLQHPNILNAVDAGHAGDIHYLVTEYVDGKDLAQFVAEHGPLRPEQACNLIRQAAAGLAHAHAQGFIHRDIKPSNLIVDAHGTLRLLDFGLVRNQQEADGLTSAGQLLGTIDFLSPEQAADGSSADCRSDLYSLGCTLLFLLTGKPPFSGDRFASVAAKIHGHLFVMPPALADHQLCDASATLPAELSGILQRLLNKNPAERFQSAGELIESLDRQQKSSPVAAVSTVKNASTLQTATRSLPLAKWTRQRIAMSGLAVMLLLIAGPLRSVVRISRASDESMPALVRASRNPLMPGTWDGRSSEHRPADQSANDVQPLHVEESDEGPTAANEQPSTETTAESSSITPTTSGPESEAVTAAENDAESATVTTSENVAEADDNSPTRLDTEAANSALTAEFRAAGNVDAGRMAIPGKLLSGKASGLLKSSRQKSQEE